MMFADRLDAAARLCKALQPWRGRNPLILAIPRGALPMGELIAQQLEGELDVEEIHLQLDVLKDRRARYTPGRGAIDAAGRIAIVVDDGLATGSTMIAALHAVRARKPEVLVCAVPVASPDSLELVRPLADEVVCLHAPDGFYAVGQFYRTFGQAEDDEAIRLLALHA